METRLSRMEGMLNLYWAEIKDAIDTVRIPNTFLFRKENFKKFRRQGIEMTVRYEVFKGFRVYSSGAFNHVENRETGEVVRGNGVKPLFESFFRNNAPKIE